jgi:Ser/Thr protein kinase RdoA (MazF antagonist)
LHRAPAAGIDAELGRIARAAIAAFDLPRASEIRPIRLLNNAVFEVLSESADRLVLRVHRPGYRAVEHIRSELAFLQMLGEELRGTPVVVPRPIESRSGEPIVCVEAAEESSPRYCDLLTWVPGRVLKQRSGLGERATFLLGEGLARIHAAAERFEPPPDFVLPCWDAETMFSAASPFRPGPMDSLLSPTDRALFHEVAERTEAVFEELDRTGGQRGIIHNDYVLINCHFSRRAHGWQLGILDFDDLGWGYFLYDLAPLLGNLFDYPDAYGRLRRALLAGYRSVRPLPSALEAHLPVLMAARHATVLTWLAAKQRRGETDLPIGRHAAVRVAEMARCLTLAGAPRAPAQAAPPRRRA